MVPVVLMLAAAQAAPPEAVDTRRLLGQSDQTARRIAEADKTRQAGKPADALDQLLRVQDEAGDDLVVVSEREYRPARVAAQRVLVTLPPAVLGAYRDRVAGPADALLAAGTKSRDPRPLQTLLDRYFPAAASEPALLLLGELHFDRGEFRQAEECWKRLLPGDAAGDPPVPDPRTDPARVRALVAVAALFQGDWMRTRDAADGLQRDHPTAAGKLAGRDGPYHETLRKLLDDPPRRPPASGPGDWTGFAGGAARDGRATGRLPRYWPVAPSWQVSLPGPADRPAVGPTPTARSVPYHPVVLDGVGYVADPLRVWAFDPRRPTVRLVFDARTRPPLQPLKVDPGEVTLTADADFPLTVADGRLFARVGRFPAGPAADPADPPTSFLVCLRPTGGNELEQVWAVPPPGRDGATAAWEAAPVWHAGRVFAAFTRLDGTTRTFAVAGYADPPGPKPLWVTEVATAPASDPQRVRQEPLTVAGDKLVFCTHAGSVLALDPVTGKPAWAVKYPPAPEPRRGTSPPARDLCPPLAAAGRVFVAPLDADRLLCLDAATGRELWAADEVVVNHLLGVTRNRLVAALAGPHNGIRGFDVATGNSTAPVGWRQHDDPHLGSFGRGLVGDDLVLWPTRQGLFLLHPDTGRPFGPPLPGTHGNLAFADGVLLVGTPFGVAGWLPATGDSPDPRTRAVGLADAGRAAEAAKVLRTAGLPDAERLIADWSDVPPAPDAPAPARPGLIVPPLPPPPDRFDPAGLASVGPELRVKRVTRLPAVGWPLRPFGDGPGLAGLDAPDPLLLVADAARLWAFRPGADRPEWMTALPPGLVVTRAAVIGPDVFAAGPGGAVRVRRADGELVWAFAPRPPPAGVKVVPPPLPPTLSDFTLVAGRLCCRLGRHQLLGIDLATGRLGWALDATGHRYEPVAVPTAVGFTHLHTPDGRHLLVRRSDGRRLLLNQFGGVVDAAGTSRVGWDGSPAVVGPGRSVVADGSDRLAVVDVCGKPGWTAHTAGGRASLSGRPPQVRTVGDGLLVAVARTHGVELEQLSRLDGTRRPGWPDEPTFLPAGTCDLPAADSDGAAVFVPADGFVYAVRLGDGAIGWRVPLPGPGRWRVRCGARAVLLVPDAPVPAEPSAVVASRIAGRLLRPGVPLPTRLLAAYDAWAGRTLPVVALDPATGRTLARLDLPTAGLSAGVHLGPGPAVAVTATAAHWFD